MQPEPAAEQHHVGNAGASPASAEPQQDPNVDKWWLSESSEDEGDGRIAQQQPQHEDELYDPQADEEDEKWVQEQRQGHVTDAILSCPGCFTTLCIDCQQHARYHTQYRAMVTINCEVKDQPMQSQVQQPPRQQQQQRHKKRRVPEDVDNTSRQQGGSGHQQAASDSEVLYPVCCAVCGTQVGAQDSDGLVHFFHVLASEC